MFEGLSKPRYIPGITISLPKPIKAPIGMIPGIRPLQSIDNIDEEIILDQYYILTIKPATEELIDFPVVVHLSNSSGLDDTDISDIFDEIGNDYTKLKVIDTSTGKDCFVEVEDWSLYKPAGFGTANATRNIGGDEDGTAGLTITGSPIDNNTYYTFNGSTDGLSNSSNLGNSSTEVIYARIRIHNKDKGIAQVIWKDGGGTKGLALGIDENGNLGLFGGLDGNKANAIIITPTDYENNIWYDIYATRTRVSLVNTIKDELIATNTGDCVTGDGDGEESIGYAYNNSPLTLNIGTAIEFFEGDIDFVKIYTEGQLRAPEPGASAVLHVKVPKISTTENTLLQLHYSKDFESNTKYIGEIGTRVAKSVWDDNFVGVYHLAQDPSLGGACILDSTKNENQGTPYGSMTNLALIDGPIGKAIEFDGVDDYVNINTVLTQSALPIFTLDLLFSTTEAGSDHESILYSVHSPSDTNIVRIANNTKILLHDLAGTPAILGTTTINDGAWHLLSMTGDTSDIKLLIDAINDINGSQVLTFDLGYKMSLAQEYDSTNSPTDFFSGQIDNL